VPDLTPEALFRRYSRYVAAIALRLLGRDDDVDDVVQDVFLAAVRGVSQVTDERAVKAWLATITVRTAHRKLRMRRVRAFLHVDESPDYERVASSDAPPDQRALVSKVYALLDRVPAADRVAWSLRHLEGERLEEVARLCGCSLATAKRRISAAHAFMEKELADE
jgi:RNA polymerase sigma-70 factor, ECF subfamily